MYTLSPRPARKATPPSLSFLSLPPLSPPVNTKDSASNNNISVSPQNVSRKKFYMKDLLKKRPSLTRWNSQSSTSSSTLSKERGEGCSFPEQQQQQKMNKKWTQEPLSSSIESASTSPLSSSSISTGVTDEKHSDNTPSSSSIQGAAPFHVILDDQQRAFDELFDGNASHGSFNGSGVGTCRRRNSRRIRRNSGQRSIAAVVETLPPSSSSSSPLLHHRNSSSTTTTTTTEPSLSSKRRERIRMCAEASYPPPPPPPPPPRTKEDIDFRTKNQSVVERKSMEEFGLVCVVPHAKSGKKKKTTKAEQQQQMRHGGGGGGGMPPRQNSKRSVFPMKQDAMDGGRGEKKKEEGSNSACYHHNNNNNNKSGKISKPTTGKWQTKNQIDKNDSDVDDMLPRSSSKGRLEKISKHEENNNTKNKSNNNTCAVPKSRDFDIDGNEADDELTLKSEPDPNHRENVKEEGERLGVTTTTYQSNNYIRIGSAAGGNKHRLSQGEEKKTHGTSPFPKTTRNIIIRKKFEPNSRSTSTTSTNPRPHLPRDDSSKTLHTTSSCDNNSHAFTIDESVRRKWLHYVSEETSTFIMSAPESSTTSKNKSSSSSSSSSCSKARRKKRELERKLQEAKLVRSDIKPESDVENIF